MEESITLLTKMKQTFDCEGQDVRAYSPLTLAYIGDVTVIPAEHMTRKTNPECPKLR